MITLVYGFNGAGKTDVIRNMMGLNFLLEDIGHKFSFGLQRVREIRSYCYKEVGRINPLVFNKPEISLHPREQLKVADYFVVAHHLGLDVVAETHSEMIMLRLLRRIRESHETIMEHEARVKMQKEKGIEPLSNDALKPDDVKVLWVEGDNVIQMHIDEEGDFINKWPRGFFNERFAEVY